MLSLVKSKSYLKKGIANYGSVHLNSINLTTNGLIPIFTPTTARYSIYRWYNETLGSYMGSNGEVVSSTYISISETCTNTSCGSRATSGQFDTVRIA